MSSRTAFLALSCATVAAWACGSSTPASEFDAGVDDAGADGSLLADASADAAPLVYSDFPGDPILDTGVPSGAAQLFGGADGGAASGGPCLIEPEVGTLFPKNWMRPRFRWIAANGENLFELRLHTQNQTRDLVVYTASTTWTMPKDMWTALTQHSIDADISMSVRGGVLAGGALSSVASGSTGPMRIAPVEAPGSIVYWNTTTKSLFGFKVGDEKTVSVMMPPQFTERPIDCVGCHSSSPDGQYVQISTKIESPSDPATAYAEGVVDIVEATQGQTATFVGAGAKQAMAQPLRGIATFSRAHWAAGDRTLITQLATSNPGTSGQLSWIDLEASQLAQATGTLARTGDPGGLAMAPTWSHDGANVTYVSCAREVDARPDLGPADLYTIPYANRAGGPAVKVAGASSAEYEENYPAYSPDDKLLAFTRVPAGGNMLFNSKKEVLVVPASGGTATRLQANDPPACTTVTSPGVWNSYAKWAPGVVTSSGQTYYWLVFSSKRADLYPPAKGTTTNKLYLTPITVKDGAVTTYAALYLWLQGDSEDNHTPAWDVFNTPPPK